MGTYCKFCNQRCFVPLPIATPPELLKLYPRGVTIIASCRGGQALEIERFGVSLALLHTAIEIMGWYQAGLQEVA